MRRYKDFVKKYFSLSEKEANGFVIFSFFMIAVLIFPWAFRYYTDKTATPPDFSYTSMEVQELHNQAQQYYTREDTTALEKFDPNNASMNQLKSFGLDEKTAARIEKYRAAGGRFKIKSDLRKIYGFPEDLYLRLHSFILLPDSAEMKVQSNREKTTEVSLNLNTANAEDLEKLKGIGPVLAERIIKFRTGLGGFVSTSQLKEVYGLDSLVARQLVRQCFIAEEFIPEQIDINNASVEEMDRHTYIDKKTAWAIFNFRKSNGKISSRENLEKARLVPDDKLKKLLPYLKFE